MVKVKSFASKESIVKKKSIESSEKEWDIDQNDENDEYEAELQEYKR